MKFAYLVITKTGSFKGSIRNTKVFGTKTINIGNRQKRENNI